MKSLRVAGTHEPCGFLNRTAKMGCRSFLSLAFCMAVAMQANAYRFYGDGRMPERRIGTADYAQRWSSDVWGVGDSLSWEVDAHARFEMMFGSPHGIMPFVERALAAWADIPSAEITWRVTPGTMAEGVFDGRNTVFVDPQKDPSFGGYARIWTEFSADRVHIVECDVGLSSRYVDPTWFESNPDSYIRAIVSTLVHEFGHCLGLGHSGGLSLSHRSLRSRSRVDAYIHPGDPAMSYGWEAGQADTLTRDDIVAATLLRPVQGWRESKGSIVGRLIAEGEPVPHAWIWALPTGAEPLRDRIGAFSNADGFFEIEGLSCGDYALLAQPIVRQGAHGGLMAAGARIEIEDTVSAGPVRVRANRSADVGEVAMRGPRRVRPHPGADATMEMRVDPVPIGERWISPCTGVNIRAERPYPADGPLWFAKYDGRFDRERWFGTRLTIEWATRNAAVVMDWAGPYRNWTWNAERMQPNFFSVFEIGVGDLFALSSLLDISISEWIVERRGEGARHAIEIAWPETTRAKLRFRSQDSTCAGEPILVCDLAGCGVAW